MFAINKRLFSFSVQNLSKFTTFPAETAVKSRAFVEAIAESKDQTAFFAWHPKKEFPYEFTSALPTGFEQKSSSLLKEHAVESAQVAWRLKRPEFTREKLAKLTFTTIHRWFPRSRDKKANFKKTPMDRRYL